MNRWFSSEELLWVNRLLVLLSQRWSHLSHSWCLAGGPLSPACHLYWCTLHFQGCRSFCAEMFPLIRPKAGLRALSLCFRMGKAWFPLVAYERPRFQSVCCNCLSLQLIFFRLPAVAEASGRTQSCIGGCPAWTLEVVGPGKSEEMRSMAQSIRSRRLTWFVNIEQVFARSWTTAVGLFSGTGTGADGTSLAAEAEGCITDTFFHKALIACIWSCWIFRSFSKAAFVVSMSCARFLRKIFRGQSTFFTPAWALLLTRCTLEFDSSGDSRQHIYSASVCCIRAIIFESWSLKSPLNYCWSKRVRRRCLSAVDFWNNPAIN